MIVPCRAVGWNKREISGIVMSTTKSSPDPNARESGRRSRILRRVAVGTLLLGSLGCVFHGRILCGMAELLVVDGHGTRATAVVVLDDGDRRFDRAAELNREGVKTVLLYRRRPNRLQRTGIKPASDELARRELLKRNLPSSHLVSLGEVPVDKSKFVTVLGDWLKQHPNQTADLLCDRFTSRTWKLLFDRADDPRLTDRIHIIPLSRVGFDETNWWRSKEGTLALIDGYFILGFHLLHSGAEPEGAEPTDADLRAAFAGDSSE